MTTPRAPALVLAHRSLGVLVGAALGLAPIAEVSAATPSLGMRLRTIMTLTPDEPGADPSAASEASEASPGDEAPIEGPVEAEAPAVEAPPPPPTDPEPSKGLGLLITGACITGAVGLPSTLFGSWIVIASHDTSDTTGIVRGLGGFVGGVFLFFGIAGLGVGVPLLAVGGYRMSRWREWKDRHQVRLTPSAGLTAYGTVTPGLALRF